MYNPYVKLTKIVNPVYFVFNRSAIQKTKLRTTDVLQRKCQNYRLMTMP